MSGRFRTGIWQGMEQGHLGLTSGERKEPSPWLKGLEIVVVRKIPYVYVVTGRGNIIEVLAGIIKKAASTLSLYVPSGLGSCGCPFSGKLRPKPVPPPAG